MADQGLVMMMLMMMIMMMIKPALGHGSAAQEEKSHFGPFLWWEMIIPMVWNDGMGESGANKVGALFSLMEKCLHLFA